MRRPIDLTNGVSIGQPFGSTEVDYTQFGLKGHHGVDYPAPIGRPVLAPESGTIIVSQNGYTDPASGRSVAGEVIVLRGTYDHWLMHLDRRHVGAGVRVSEGQHIANSGNTGYTFGPHLHWSVRPLNPNMQNGYRGFVDPATVLNQPPVRHPATQGVKIMDTDAKVKAQYFTLRGSEGTPGERAGWLGKTYEQFNAIARVEAAARAKQLVDLQTALKNEQNKPAREVIKEVEKIVTEYVDRPVEVVKEVQVERFPSWVPEWIKQLLEKLFKEK